MTRPGINPSIWDARALDPSAVLLTDKVAIVTGAAQGIGEATAVALARFGAHVAICDRDAPGLESTRAEIDALGRRTHTGVLDVRDEDAVFPFVAAVGAAFGKVDILVNNAGGGFWSPFLDVSAKGEHALIRENFGSVTLFIRHTVPLMTDGGSIINVTSVEGHRAGPGFAIYSAMKAAVTNLTFSLSMELAPRRVRINCIAPDMIPTPGDVGLGDASGAIDFPGIENTPWPETGSVHDCAAAAVYLASDMSRFVTGTSIHVDGGTWAAHGWKAKTGGGFTL
ncbi:MAG TPA: SDR family oxidoreductase [Acidimicrobiales bacterium]|jgi:NAD(P)-dependent dehydrogenase (short-subunit alcohol dehydrogenase family)|nr:SDR family oxidoreductase [Acidimicrobiales bacterium]